MKELSGIVHIVKQQPDFDETSHDLKLARIKQETATDVASDRQDHLLHE